MCAELNCSTMIRNDFAFLSVFGKEPLSRNSSFSCYGHCTTGYLTPSVVYTLLYADDVFILFPNKADLDQLTQKLNDRFMQYHPRLNLKNRVFEMSGPSEKETITVS